MSLLNDIREILALPAVEIRLLLDDHEATDPHYRKVVEDFYDFTRQRHPKFPMVRQFRWGVALCVLPPSYADYFMLMDGSARRNIKKAQRLGYTFGPLDYNRHLDDVAAIRLSTPDRQGALPASFLSNTVEPCHNPEPLTPLYAYPFFGVFKDGSLVAYVNCLVAGEICMIEHIFGHAAHQADGIVPLLIASTVEYSMHHHPRIKYVCYGTYYGAGETMRRFKRKFGFVPHRVTWRPH